MSSPPPDPNISGSPSPGGNLDQFLHSEFKREGSDWSALFNPKVERHLDVNLLHSFPHQSIVCCVHFSRDGKYLATAGNRTAQIFDTATGQRICEFVHESYDYTGDLYIRSVRFSSDGKLLVTGSEDRKIRVFNVAYKALQTTYDGHQQDIYSLDLSSDGRFIVSGSADRTTRVWNLVENTCKVFTIVDVENPTADAGVTSVAISPRGDLVAAGSLDNMIRIWEVASGLLVEVLRGHGGSVVSVAFTPDGKGLVTGSLDKTLKLWDMSHLGLDGDRGRSGPPSCVDFTGHNDFVFSVSVSNDSQWVVSGSKDRSVRVWDSKTGASLLQLEGHKSSVLSVDLSRGNNLLATGGGDNTARIWSLTRVA